MEWPLFLKFKDNDIYNFEWLHIPINNTEKEMNDLVLSLVKILIDSLNEEEIGSQIKKSENNGSINKLEEWFKEKKLSNYEVHIKFLRDLQTMRSSGAAHRKGERYKEITQKFGLQVESYANVFSEMLKNANSFLDYIECNLENLNIRKSNGFNIK